MKLNVNNLDSKKLQAILYDQYRYVETPPDIDEFLDSPYYLGVGQPGSLFNIVFPFWRRELKRVFPNPYVMNTSYLLFHGAIGEYSIADFKLHLLLEGHNQERYV